ncbi:hypothetical protein RRG08_052200 [Elysia crispata]|uniref:Uncharacterized protein n=1 Tax=Elysia crispata TaxID=231223 RepID=A0AAE0XVE4_9GAST|nr:hypothetical protein RRG08_052200 [Elysia crispata]
MICLRLVFLAVLIAATCAATVGHDMFGHRIIKGQLREPLLNDISGMAASRVHPGIVYVHNHQVDSNYVYAVDVDNARLVRA